MRASVASRNSLPPRRAALASEKSMGNRLWRLLYGAAEAINSRYTSLASKMSAGSERAALNLIIVGLTDYHRNVILKALAANEETKTMLPLE